MACLAEQIVKNKKTKSIEDQHAGLCDLPDGLLRQLILFLTNDLVTLSNFSMMGKVARKWANKELKKQLYEYMTEHHRHLLHGKI